MVKIVKIRGNDIDIGFNEGDIAIIQAKTPVSKPPRPPTFRHGFLRDHFILDR